MDAWVRGWDGVGWVVAGGPPELLTVVGVDRWRIGLCMGLLMGGWRGGVRDWMGGGGVVAVGWMDGWVDEMGGLCGWVDGWVGGWVGG